GTWGGRPPRPQGRGGRGGVRPRAVGVRVGCGGGGAPWGEGPRPARRSRPGSGGGLRGRRRGRSAVRSLRKGRWRLLTFLLVVLAGGWDFPGQPREADRPPPADQVKSFHAPFRVRRAGCPGVDGKLGPAPSLNDPIFLAIVPDAELRHVISEGRAVSAAQRSPMPAFARARGGPLTDAQVQVLADGIKKRWGPAA